MEQKNKVKLLKVLAFPASAAFMMGVGVTAIQADEVEEVQSESAVETLTASDTTVVETSSDPVIDEDTNKTEEPTTPVVIDEPTKEEIVTPVVEKKEETAQVTQPVTTTVTQASVQKAAPKRAPRTEGVATIDGQTPENPFTTLQDAINAAQAGQTVTLLKDITENITIKKAIILDLNGHTLTGLGTDSVVKISGDATVKNGTITGGVTSGTNQNGGGININGKYTVNLDGLTISNNKARFGGGMYVNNGANVTINNCKFNSNKTIEWTNSAGSTFAPGEGGAIIIKQSCTVTIANSTFNKNEAVKNAGGAISIGTKSVVTIDNCKIYENVAGSRGGAIHIASSIAGTPTTVNISNTDFWKNNARDGGAIGVIGWNNKLIIEGGNFYTNTAQIDGGAIFFSGGTISESIADLTISSANFYGNKAQNGGGIYIKDGLSLTIPSNVNIYNNTASVAGDDLAAVNTKVTLNGITNSNTLDKCKDKINGWFDDSEGNRWNAHSNNHASDSINRISDGTYSDDLYMKAAHSNGKVIIHYVDDKGNTISEDDTLIDATGKEYSTSSKKIAKYTYVRVDGNESGTYGDSDEIEITYVYTLTKGKVIIHYVDQDGNKLTDDVTIEDVLDKEYTSDKKSFDGYTFVSVDGDASGVITDGTKEITYTYKKVEAPKPDEPKKPEEPKKDDTKKEENKEQPKSDVQPTSVTTATTATQATESTGVQTGVDTNAAYLTSLAGISLAGALLLKKKKDQE